MFPGYTAVLAKEFDRFTKTFYIARPDFTETLVKRFLAGRDYEKIAIEVAGCAHEQGIDVTMGFDTNDRWFKSEWYVAMSMVADHNVLLQFTNNTDAVKKIPFQSFCHLMEAYCKFYINFHAEDEPQKEKFVGHIFPILPKFHDFMSVVIQLCDIRGVRVRAGWFAWRWFTKEAKEEYSMLAHFLVDPLISRIAVKPFEGDITDGGFPSEIMILIKAAIRFGDVESFSSMICIAAENVKEFWKFDEYCNFLKTILILCSKTTRYAMIDTVFNNKESASKRNTSVAKNSTSLREFFKIREELYEIAKVIYKDDDDYLAELEKNKRYRDLDLRKRAAAVFSSDDEEDKTPVVRTPRNAMLTNSQIRKMTPKKEPSPKRPAPEKEKDDEDDDDEPILETATKKLKAVSPPQVKEVKPAKPKSREITADDIFACFQAAWNKKQK